MRRNNRIKRAPGTAIKKSNRKKGKQNRNKIKIHTHDGTQNKRTGPRTN